jgi:NAD(P)-dependent dehydrogenase (short-subunit alcohol dehydrogenase family)
MERTKQQHRSTKNEERSPMSQLDGRVAIVTGAGRGIGRAEALALAEHGAAVVVNDLGTTVEGTGSAQSPADAVVQEITERGGTAIASYDDVSDFTAAGKLLDRAVGELGRVDILVNNAGSFRRGPFLATSEDDWDRVIAVHLKGTFNTCRHAASLMADQRSGRIINTASSHWRNPQGMASYAAAKAGVVGLTWDLAWELQKFGVTANAIAPLARTRVYDAFGGAGAITDSETELIPRNDEAERVGPEWVSPLVVYLASDLAQNVNGCVFRVGNGKIGIYSHPTEARTIYSDTSTQQPWTQEALERLLPATVLSAGTRAPHLPDPD